VKTLRSDTYNKLAVLNVGKDGDKEEEEEENAVVEVRLFTYSELLRTEVVVVYFKLQSQYSLGSPIKQAGV
jgi:hypothetical protein